MKTFKVICEISARHHHPSEAGDYSKKADLSQAGHWVSSEKKEELGMQFSIVLPPRKTDDGKGVFEISLTDWHKHLKGTEPSFNKGTYQVKLRHFHCDQKTADEYGLVNGQKVKVRQPNGPRRLTFEDVDVRIDSWAVPRVHLDTDEANAAFIRNGDEVELIIE
ncbi:MAG: PduL/EutD family phosphate acyltransferase [Minisyncoccia bacterium]